MTVYHRETKLDFARDVQAAVLDIANHHIEQLEYRAPPWTKVMDPKTSFREMVDILGREDAERVVDRRRKMVERFGPAAKKISFKQYSLPKELNDALIDAAPKGIPRDECIPIVQISTGGNILYPHKGHYRNASLFCLLQGNDEETRWYRETKPFQLVSDFRIPDMTCLEQADATTLRKGVWTIFNHFEWHSVHGLADRDFIVRVNVGIDLKTWTVDQLIEAIKDEM
jgi:hypothetical protein